MNTRELKKLLKDSFQMEEELHEFCVDALRHIYGESAELAIEEFNQGVEGIEFCGCIQGFECIKSRMEKNEEHKKARLEEEKKEQHRGTPRPPT